ncbi:MAG: phosphoribosyltransferase [Thioalkalivibrio sp.]|nr:MAG: phosphoribosyltransferase [Thioalkalivibrio sp.]
MADAATMPVRLIGLGEVVEACDRVARALLDADVEVDTVVAIARGGFMPARFLCDFLDISRLLSIQIGHYEAGAQSAGEATVEHPLGGDVSGRRVLLVDDVNDSGDTLQAALAYLRDQSPAGLHSAVLHEKSNTRCRADFKAEVMREWRWVLYPWAVVEDAGQFIRDMDPVPDTRQAIHDALRERHELVLDPSQLDRVLRYNRLAVDDSLAATDPDPPRQRQTDANR